MLHGLALGFLAIEMLDATPADLALLNASALLPPVVLGLVAAGWVDRLPRRRILLAMDFARAPVVASIPAAAWWGVLSLWQLYVVAALVGFMSFVFQAADHAILPAVVDEEELVEANSKLRAAEAVTEGGAFASGGWLVQLFGAPVVLLVDAVSYVVSAFFLLGVKPRAGAEPDGSPQPEAPSIWREALEGLRFIAGNPVLLTVTGCTALLAFAFRVTGPVYLPYVYTELGFEPGVLGMIAAVGGGTSLLGALLCRRVTNRLGAGPTMILGATLFGASILVLPFAPGAGLLGISVLVANQLGDGFEVLFDVNQKSIRQTLTPGEMLGRVSGTLQVATSAAMLLGVAVGGVLGETIGARPTLVLAGMMPLLAAAWMALSVVRYRR
jgi:MFS family permease